MKTVNPDLDMFITLQDAEERLRELPSGTILQSKFFGEMYYVDASNKAHMVWPSHYKLLKQKI